MCTDDKYQGTPLHWIKPVKSGMSVLDGMSKRRVSFHFGCWASQKAAAANEADAYENTLKNEHGENG